MTLLDFLSGAVTMGFFVCGLFFWQFRARTRKIRERREIDSVADRAS